MRRKKNHAKECSADLNLEMMIKTSGLSGWMTSRSTEWSRIVLVRFLIEWIGLNRFILFNNIS